MGIFDRNELTTLNLRSDTQPTTAIELRDALDNPAIPINSGAAFDLVFSSNATESGEVVNEHNALEIVTVYGCVRVIAESIASLPLKLMEYTDRGHKEARDNNLYYVLSTEANPETTAYTFFETLVGSLAYTGNGYAEIERNELGQAIALWQLHPLKTTPRRAAELMRASDGSIIKPNEIYYQTTDGMGIAGHARIITASNMLHVPLFSFDGIKGISPIAACRRTLGLASAQEKSGARYFGNNSRPNAIITNKGAKMLPKEMQELRQSWEQQQGAVNQGRIAILPNADLQYQALSLSNEDSQWIQSRGFSQAQIAEAIFRVPAHMVGDMSRLSGSNSENMHLQFTTDCLQPYLTRIESEIVRKLIPRTGRNANKFFVRFSVDQLLRCDFKTMQEGYSAGINGGWYSANEIRRKLGENPGGPELDVYRVPVNYQNATQLVDDVTEKDKPLEDDDETGPDAPTDSTEQPTQAERNLLGAYTTAYLTLYKDAFNRAIKRNKRDYESFNTTFRTVLECISNTAIGFRDGTNLGIDEELTPRVVTDVVKGMVKRANKWPEQLKQEEIGSVMIREFNKAVRSIHVEISKTVAAKKAIEQLRIGDNQNDE